MRLDGFRLCCYFIAVPFFIEIQCVKGFFTNKHEQEKAQDDRGFGVRGAEITGRMFVTMLGYPSKCEQQGISHSCTLSLACWLVGGSSQPGCGASPWIVACCVTAKTSLQLKNIDIDNDFDNSLMPTIQKRIDNFEFDDVCGISGDRVMMKRIIGGDEAQLGQFPWIAFIKIANYQCGGVLVSRKFVATAAHCIISAPLSDTLVYLGELDTQDTGKVLESAPAELHRIRRRIIHPLFEFKSSQPDRYDLALLELVTVAGRHFHISPICLPAPSLILTGRSAVVAGWGKVRPSADPSGTNILRSARVPILSIKECLRWHGTKQIKVELHEEMLCAGHENGAKDACLGDSGGPLIVLEKGRWTLAGIISAGFGCGEPQQPGIYHKVPVTSDWIRQIIGVGVDK